MDTAKATDLFTDLLRQLEEIRTVRDGNKRDAFQRRLLMIIRQSFGEKSEYLRDANEIQWYSLTDNEPYVSEAWSRGWNQSLNLIRTILEEIRIQSADGTQHQSEKLAASTKKVFVVHGHDEAMKDAVARTLAKLDLEPIILHEQPNKGRTIIEKFTDYSDVGFAVILLSPDDMGYTKRDDPEEAKPRARQNVILELGYFIGTLGRDRVLPLYKEETNFEIPSDYSGVVFTPFDDKGNWRLDLVRELHACGFTVDANRLL